MDWLINYTFYVVGNDLLKAFIFDFHYLKTYQTM